MYNFWRHRLTRINAHLSADDQLCGSLIRKSPFGAACLAPPSGHSQFYSAKGLVYLLIHQLAQKRIKRKVLTKVAVLLHTSSLTEQKMHQLFANLQEPRSHCKIQHNKDYSTRTLKPQAFNVVGSESQVHFNGGGRMGAFSRFSKCNCIWTCNLYALKVS